MMRSIAFAAVCAALAPLYASEAAAHGVAGKRVFPSTLTIDDPAVADEASLPTIQSQRHGASDSSPASRETDITADHDGRISPAESRKIAEHILPNLAEFRYFTYLWVDGRDLATHPPRDFVASAENGLVTFRFVIDLPSPIDPQRQVLKVEINDRDYYVEIRLAKKDPVGLRAPSDLACRPRVRDDVENAYPGYGA